MTLLFFSSLHNFHGISFQIAMNGFTEVLTWILCSSKEISTMLNRQTDESTAVVGNPRTSDFEVFILCCALFICTCARAHKHSYALAVVKNIKICHLSSVLKYRGTFTVVWDIQS